MALDVNSLCPGGSGKKIKFCCSRLASDLEKLDRMAEGGQIRAAQAHLERLLVKHPDRACLLALRIELLSDQDKPEETFKAVQAFAERQPDNPVAVAELALSMLEAREKDDHGTARRAVETFLRAFEGAGPVDPKVYAAMGRMCALLVGASEFLGARRLAHLQCVLCEAKDPEATGVARRLNSANVAPLVIKEERMFVRSVEDGPHREAFNEAMGQGNEGVGLTQLERHLTTLAEQFPDAVPVWQNLAIARGWMADRVGASEAWHRLAQLDIPEEDAVEAEAMAVWLSPDFLGDNRPILNLRWNLIDEDAAWAAMEALDRFHLVPYDGPTSEDGPKPRGTFTLLDRDLPSLDDLPSTGLPRILASGLFFGRRTEQPEAQITVPAIPEWNVNSAIDMVSALLGEHLRGDPVREVNERGDHVGHLVNLLLAPTPLPSGLSPTAFRQQTERDVLKYLTTDWLEHPSPYLDNRSPGEVSGNDAYALRLQAIMELIDWMVLTKPGEVDLTALRDRLGLPRPEPVDPDMFDQREVPLSRLHRVDPACFSDDELVSWAARAGNYSASRASKRLLDDIFTRPSLAKSPSLPYLAILRTAQVDSPQEALDVILRVRDIPTDPRMCGQLDMAELRLQYMMGRPDHVVAIIQHVQEMHGQDEGMMEQVVKTLADLNALLPDGRMVLPKSADPPEPSIIVPGEGTTAEPGKLWTPDAADGTPKSGEKAKLWTPSS